MPISLVFEKATLSLEYDTLTVYPRGTTNQGADKTTTVLLYNACIRDLEKNVILPDDLSKFYDTPCERDIKEDKDFHRVIKRDESDHNLSHQSSVELGLLHAHFKYNQQITRDKLIVLLGIVVEHDLISSVESDQFIAAYDSEYISKVKETVEELTKGDDKKASAVALNKFVQTCKDNVFLVAMHDYLLAQPKYKYLIKTGSVKGIWRGQVTVAGDIKPVSQTWAKFEKSVELKMINNVKMQCSRFSKRIAAERAEEFSRHAFFKIARNALSLSGVNSAFEYFQTADEPHLEAEYKKHFSSFIK